jgi:hypothetical protein
MTNAAGLRVLLASGLVALAALLHGAHAQDGAANTPPRSGDAWVDATLADIDRYAARYPDAFADELVRYDSAPRALVEALLADPQWTPGDLYFACALGQVAGQPCRAVAQRWQHDRASGWAAIARGFGVAPDSDAFHRLKRGIVLSYARWARPLQVDASLHADFPKLPLAAPVPLDKAAAGARASRQAATAMPASTPAKPKKHAVKGTGRTP